MNKIFYKLDIDYRKDLRSLCDFITLTYANGIKSYIDYRFVYSLGIKGFVVGIEINNKEQFESLLLSHDINYVFLGLSKEYSFYKSNNSHEKASINSLTSKNDDKIIPIFTVNDDVYGSSKTSRTLSEGFLFKQAQISIYIKSNEMSGHFVPHVHCNYGDKINYCVLSLIDMKVLSPKNKCLKNLSKIVKVVSEHINECRVGWNKAISLIKFKTDSNNQPTDELIYSEP